MEYFLKKENLSVLISIVVDIAYHNPRTYPISIAILSKLFNLLDNIETIKDIVKKVINKFDNIPNTGHMQIWLQRATIKLTDIEQNYNRLLLKPFSIFGYMSLLSYFNLKYKSNFNITKI